MRSRLWKALGQWRAPSLSNGWTGRDGVGLLSLGDDLYMLGGWNTAWTAPHTTNEVWRSSDEGQTWTQLANAPWTPRHSAGWLVHDGKIWVIGGDVNSKLYQKDVWSFDGTTWVQVSANAAPLSAGRVLHQVYSHAGKMWVVGGQTVDDYPPPTGPASPVSTKTGVPYYDDVWSSEDGATWTLVSDGHSWSPRGLIIGNAVKDGYMWIVAGGAYDTEGNPRVYKNDVWKSADGVTWTQVTANGGFPARQYCNALVLGEDLVLIAGWDGANRDDVWASKDGVAWRELKGSPWAARHAAGATVHKGEIFLLGGPLTDTSVRALS
ncbi:MAG: hypothetical protein ACOH2M_27065 [Cypionkella sp.]